MSVNTDSPGEPPIEEPTRAVTSASSAETDLVPTSSRSADADPVSAAEPEVHFHFPVTVEIIGTADPELEERIIARVFDELNDELASRP